MKLHFPTVGPIVGYTTSSEARIWLRGDLQRTPEGHRRAFGVVRVREKGVSKFGDPRFVPLMPHFDVTGVCVMLNLKAGKDYEYQAGWFFAETELDNLDATQDVDWTDAASGTFTTGVSGKNAPRSYFLGSCRYLLRLFGGTLWDERGDKVFESMVKQIDGGQAVHGVVMMGDQIYADDLNFAGPDRNIDDYLKRYQIVFGQKHFRSLTSRLPTYMILDDHEIEDNWPSKATDKDWVTLYPAAVHAYQIYQSSHSPVFEVDAEGRITGTPDRFWYQFTDGCCDWFVMDSRCERVWSDDATKRRMIKSSQMKALLKWLDDGSGRVKMVVTSVPFFPDTKSEVDDKWGGFLPERTAILDHILDRKIRKVVFISGDVHCSFSAELTTPQDPAFKVISVISSSFFWPYPHMGEDEFALSGQLSGSSVNTYRVGAASKVHSTDNFGRIDVDPNGIFLSFFERKGAKLGKQIRHNF